MLHDDSTMGALVGVLVGATDGCFVATGDVGGICNNGVPVGVFVTGVLVGTLVGALVGVWIGSPVGRRVGTSVGDIVGGLLTMRNDNFSMEPMVPFTFVPSYVVTVILC